MSNEHKFKFEIGERVCHRADGIRPIFVVTFRGMMSNGHMEQEFYRVTNSEGIYSYWGMELESLEKKKK